MPEPYAGLSNAHVQIDASGVIWLHVRAHDGRMASLNLGLPVPGSLVDSVVSAWATEQIATGGWVRVLDEMPSDHARDVVTLSSDGNRRVGWWNGVRWCGGPEEIVTHWRDLPELPAPPGATK